jgi:predicted 2-oxoglutarate/Fe(II)-dependent dioxygenase YbiX
VLRELQSYSEEWAGIPLIAHQAYGFRVYRNQSQLFMHSDRIQTHVVSFILHIDSESTEPWPIFIEDMLGRTHEVTLTPGDILFYESSKCLHGRPRPFNGSWYTSVFVHYYPRYAIDEPS